VYARGRLLREVEVVLSAGDAGVAREAGTAGLCDGTGVINAGVCGVGLGVTPSRMGIIGFSNMVGGTAGMVLGKP